ncbi:ABC transporter substrate-binding protein [Paenibacillus eucommiae]|uniref:Multiple sugar transport system substrate-binding protein n=1 Tax=Paenibacillus eucommiae TaxID=1355755 RepID=A0ABS4IZI4_9BACL|nr:extracellular solute-binding protein [Paenibacillus eucommiae]MBP1992997.1 multiple sugar transport system substrate-binding protein [Paenibacillus eucommiae]
MRRFNLVLVLIVGLSIVLAGCSLKGNKDSDSTVMKALEKDEKVTIKVMYYDERSFFQQYGNLFYSKFPNVDIEVISNQSMRGEGKDPEKEFDKIIEEQKPDVLMLDINQYEKMAADGKLLDLDVVIQKDKFDIENILPAVTDILRSKGNGRLYGLAASFYSNVLMYNRDLFEQYGIEVPRDQMSWSEVLDLAKRFPTTGEEDKRIYGFFQNNYGQASVYQFASMIGGTEKLSIIDPENLKVTINTDDWKRVFQTSIDALNSKAMNSSKAENNNMQTTYGDFLKRDYFISGRAAMTIGSYYMLDQIKQAKNEIKDFKPFNWDLVTAPVDLKNPDLTNSFGVSELMAINAQSTEQRAAWEFIKYLNSDEFAKIISRSTQQLLSRTSYIKDKDGHNLEAFYKLKADPDLYKGYEKVPQNFYPAFNQIIDEEMKQMVEGKKSLDEALLIIQNKGQEAMDKAKIEAEAEAEADAKTEN